MGYPDSFTGYCVDSPQSWTDFYKHELTPKTWGDEDIDVEIDCCGVCGSDVHTINGGWADYKGPLCVGHEVVGKAVRVGPKVKSIKVGDRVGVGAQVGSCQKCDNCKNGDENYCQHKVDTYGTTWPDGSSAHGGYASHIRSTELFTFKIPDALASETAAPLMCAGITSYAPLKRAGVGPGKRVGIVGIGGLGHLGVQWAVAMGAEVYGFTHSPSKVDNIKKLGAKEAIVTTEQGWEKPWFQKFDFILNCADMTHKFDMATYFSTLKIDGSFHMVGIPDKPLPPMPAALFTVNCPKLTGSHIGNHKEIDGMLALAAEKGIKPWVETLKVSEAGCREAVTRVNENKVHYRFTLTHFGDAFGTNPK